MTLAEISGTVSGGVTGREVPEPSDWWLYTLNGDIQVWVRARMSPWRTKQVRSALRKLADQLDAIAKEEDEKNDRN